jgi:signal transduction histidine kinase
VPFVPLVALVALLLALAAFVWLARRNSAINRWFATFTLFVAVWVLGISGLQSGVHLDAWARVAFAGATLIPASFLAFMRAYPTPSSWPSTSLLRGTLMLAGAIAILSLSTPLMVYDTTMAPAGLTRQTGPLYTVFFIYFLVTWVAAIVVFAFKWRVSRGLASAQLQYLGAGIILSGVGGISANLLLPMATGRSTYSWIGPYFSLILVAMVGHAIIRHRLMDLRLFISRGLAYALAMGVASALLITGARLISPAWEAETLFVHPNLVVVTIVALALLSSPAQRFISRLIDPYLYRGIEHSAALGGATRRLSRLMQPAELASELRQILAEVLVSESFTLLVKSFPNDSFERLSMDTPPVDIDPRALAALHAGQPDTSVIVVNPTEETGGTKRTHAALRAAGVEVLVTLGRRGQLLGMVLLGPRRSGDAYFKNDLGFIESVADLASIALENALLYKQRIQMLEYSDRLLESLDSAVVAIDVEGRITSFNPAATKLLGLSDEYHGALMHVLPSEIGWALVLALSGGWHPREVEVTIDHVVRGILHVILSTAVLHDDEKRISGALVVVTDLSAVKALERNQRRVEHLAIMARFYAGIAHEIRNPLAAISNLIAMLPDRFDDPEYRDTAVRLLPMEVSRIVRLADRLRLMAPSEGGKLSVVSIPPLLHDIVAIHSPTAHEQQVKIQLHCADELPKIHGDPGQLVQLFVNLLRNAMEAMPEGGTVTIEADRSKGRIGADSVIVRVLDEGIGIDPTVRPKIFDPFFTTKPSGTGLGLSICREIADFHRARLALLPRSLLDGGTVAEVEFPSLPLEPSPA